MNQAFAISTLTVALVPTSLAGEELPEEQGNTVTALLVICGFIHSTPIVPMLARASGRNSTDGANRQ